MTTNSKIIDLIRKIYLKKLLKFEKLVKLLDKFYVLEFFSKLNEKYLEEIL